MNKIFLTIIVFMGCLTIIFPDSPQNYRNQVELFLVTTGLNSPIVSLTLTNQSQCWDYDYSPTNEYDSETLTPTSNNLGGFSEGFNFVKSQDVDTFPVFTFGLYKVTTNINSNFYFYLDYRDQRYCVQGSDGWKHNDIWITYDGIKFFINTDGGSWVNPRIISQGQVFHCWDIAEEGNPHTDLFANYWANCLVEVNDGNNHPTLVWGTKPNYSATYYNIYRQFGGGNPQIVNTTANNIFDWTDLSIDLNNTHLGVTAVHYFVKPGNDSGESGSSNTVTVNVQNGNQQPVKPANFALTSSPAYHPYLSWVYTPEPDVYINSINGFILEKRIKGNTPPITWGSWSTIATLSGSITIMKILILIMRQEPVRELPSID
jgi:hypothetical protein